MNKIGIKACIIDFAIKLNRQNPYEYLYQNSKYNSIIQQHRKQNCQNYFCPHCHATRNQLIPFKAKEHFITTELESYAGKLLAFGLTNKEVSEITGLNKNIIKVIDLKRLKDLYTIDEEWMDGVEAVACDMNSDFQEAFEEKCQHIQVVFDYFHIIKNFNDKVISETREGEQGKVIEKSGKIFRRNEVVRKTGYVDLYESLIRENKLLFTVDLIKEKLSGPSF